MWVPASVGWALALCGAVEFMDGWKCSGMLVLMHGGVSLLDGLGLLVIPNGLCCGMRVSFLCVLCHGLFWLESISPVVWLHQQNNPLLCRVCTANYRKLQKGTQ